MNPLEFIELALRLSGEATEASRRSAVSRGYYGAYHIARELIESCGVQFADAAETHSKLCFCLDQSLDKEVVVAARKLTSLRKARSDADYDLHSMRFKGPAYTHLQLHEVRSVVDCLNAAQSRLSAFRPNVRAYARILRMRVVGDD